jgi:hypothetical protein
MTLQPFNSTGWDVYPHALDNCYGPPCCHGDSPPGHGPLRSLRARARYSVNSARKKLPKVETSSVVVPPAWRQRSWSDVATWAELQVFRLRRG